MSDIRIIKGPVGEARQVKVKEEAMRPDWSACVGTWVVHAPGWSPAWCHFCLTIVGLRDLPGVRPAHRNYPEATHEFILGALNPDFPLDWDKVGTDETPGWKWLTPLNVVQQFHGVEDDEAAKILEALVEDAVQGKAIIEPQGIVGGTEWWTNRLRELGATVGA